eukprot:6357561-Alexandrium_andersonii.AAC.1
MSASLVGSEMCIRDSPGTQESAGRHRKTQEAAGSCRKAQEATGHSSCNPFERARTRSHQPVHRPCSMCEEHLR